MTARISHESPRLRLAEDDSTRKLFKGATSCEAISLMPRFGRWRNLALMTSGETPDIPSHSRTGRSSHRRRCKYNPPMTEIRAEAALAPAYWASAPLWFEWRRGFMQSVPANRPRVP